MARVNTYLNFMGDTEEALALYARVFGTELAGPVMRMSDMPSDQELGEGEGDLVAHAELPILGGHLLMATDMLESMGHELRLGNNVTVCLELDSKEDADRIYAGLAEGGTQATGLADMPWGAYWGTCQDRFGIRWMFSYIAPAA